MLAEHLAEMLDAYLLPNLLDMCKGLHPLQYLLWLVHRSAAEDVDVNMVYAAESESVRTVSDVATGTDG